MKFFGNDKEHSLNADICQLLGSFDDKRSDFESYFSDKETYDYCKTRILEQYSDIPLTKTKLEEIGFKERIRRRDALLEAHFNKKKDIN